jgi:radical SAM superfamily enzyme YgiQ (UPF0313 family)
MRLALINYDNGSYIPQPPHHLAYLVAAAESTGTDVSVVDMALRHHADEDLAAVLELLAPDVIGLGVIGGYWQYQQAKRVSRVINDLPARSRLTYMLGGHMPAADPEWALQTFGADSVVVGDGESVVEKLGAGVLPERVHKAGRVACPDAYMPAWWEVGVYKRTRYPNIGATQFGMPVLTARGCPYSCSFCYRMVAGHVERSVDAVCEEVAWLKHEHGVTYANFDDELLMSSDRRIHELCDAILSRELTFDWMCNGRLNRATTENLALMKRAGCTFVNYGVEALDDNVLEQMNKHLTVEQIHRGVQATLQAGISPGLNVMWGNPGDTPATLGLLVAFLSLYDDGAQMRTIRPVTPYPGTPLFHRAVGEGRIRGTADFYERSHVNSDLPSVHWCTEEDGTPLSDASVCAHLQAANAILLRRRRQAIAQTHVEQLERLYVQRDTTFRGWRHT